MGILKKIGKMIADVEKDPSVKKGERFENFVRNNLFVSAEYEMEEKTHPYEDNRAEFVKSSKNPDYRFKSKKTGKTFWVEAKFRSSYVDNAVEWCKDYQLKRYLEINRETPVFIVIGVGESASNPENVFIVPVKHAKYTKLFISFLRKYEFNPKQPVNPHQLWKLL